MRGKSNMENRKNTQPTKIHCQQDISTDPDWIWTRWSVSRAICPRICNQKPRSAGTYMQGSASPSGEPICALVDSVMSSYSIARVSTVSEAIKTVDKGDGQEQARKRCR